MHLFEWALDARKTTGGKILAIILSLTLVFSLSTWSANAFAEEQTETPTEEAVETEAVQPAVVESASVQEDAIMVASEETPESDEAQTLTTAEGEDENSSNTEQSDGSTPESDANEESAESSVVYDEASKTLTIMNVETISKNTVASYKNTAEKIVLRNIGTIEQEAFAEFKMKTLEIDRVEHIGYAFRSCINMTDLTISNVGKIDTYAFYNPAKLKSVSISHVEAIGDNVFNVYNGATALETVRLEDLSVGNRMFAEHKNLVDLSFTNVGTIGFQAFMNCTGLTSLDLSGKVGSLGDSAFLGCIGMTELDLDGVELSGSHPFYACTGLTTVTVKNADVIGKQAFTGCTGITKVTLENIGTIGEQAFSVYGDALPACTALRSISLKNVGTVGKNAFASCVGLETANMGTVGIIDEYAFYNCTGLQSVFLGSVKEIGNFAFWNCENLTSVNSLSNVSDSIGGFSFYGCKNLKGLTVNDAAKMGYVGTSESIMKRVEEILAGQFKLDQAENIGEITGEEGWDSTTENRDAMWNTYENGTQVVQQARWADEEAGVAEVKVDAYFTAQKQMDYVFVIDLSASMAQLGNETDKNSRFYDMQSKLLDVTHQLLSSEGYDCQVAFVTFGGAYNGEDGTRTTTKFYSNADEAEAYIRSLEPKNENTDYTLGISGASGLLKMHGDRQASVVFLSDGMPNYDGSNKISDRTQYLEDLKWMANDIKNAGASVYGVLQSVSDSQRSYAEEAMKAMCSEGLFFTSTDTKSFSDAVNLAVSAVYPEFTITIPVGDDFENVENINVSTQGGTAEYDAETNSIVWTINGMPFTKHTLTFNESIKSDLLDRVGTFDYLNNGAGATGEGATIATGGKTINLIESTILSREVLPTVVPDPEPTTPTDPIQPSTPEQPDTPTVPQQPTDPAPGDPDGDTSDDATTPATPAGGATTLTPAAGGAVLAGDAGDGDAGVVIPDDDNPLAGPDDAIIEDDENPLAAFDGPQCWTHIWMIVGIVLTAIYGAAVIARRLGYARKIDKIDRNMTGASRDVHGATQTQSATYHA